MEKIYRKKKVYQIDTLFAAHGRTVILPPAHLCDLNPIELAWREIKKYTESCNTTADMPLTRLQELEQEGARS